MVLFIWTIPLMALVALAAAVPLVVVSRREVTDLVHEAEMRFERHRRAQPLRHRGARRHTTAMLRTPRTGGDGRRRAWHEPVLVHKR